MIGLGGCRAARLRSQNTVAVPGVNITQTTAPAQDALPQQSNQTATPVIHMPLTQPPTQAPDSQINTAIPSTDLSQTANNLTQSLDNILQDLDATDTLNNVQ